MSKEQTKPQNCARCRKSTGDLTEVVNPGNPQKTMWVCDACVKQGYVLASYARMKAEGQLPDNPSSSPAHH